MRVKNTLLTGILSIALSSSALAQTPGLPPVPTSLPAPCSAFGTIAGTCVQGGAIAASGPTGTGTTIPVITYNAAGQLTAVTTAATGVTSNGTAAVGQLPGTTTNDNASTGNIGEYLSSNISSGSAIAFTTATPVTITSITLTAGDWDVRADIVFTGAASTTVTRILGSISTADNTINSIAGARADTTFTGNTVFNTDGFVPVHSGPFRVSVSGSTPYFMAAQCDFLVSTCSGYGLFSARRVR
jgi:hypothetical protein